MKYFQLPLYAFLLISKQLLSIFHNKLKPNLHHPFNIVLRIASKYSLIPLQYLPQLFNIHFLLPFFLVRYKK